MKSLQNPSIVIRSVATALVIVGEFVEFLLFAQGWWVWYNQVMSSVAYPHIEITDGTPYIAGTPLKVRMIVLDHVAYKWDAEQIQQEHPQLTLGQVYAALGYYYDHKELMDRDLEERLSYVEAMRAAQDDSSLIDKARCEGKELP